MTKYLADKIKLKQLEIEHARLAIEREQRAKVYDVYFFRKSLAELLHAWGMNMVGVVRGTAMPLSSVRGIAIWAMGAWADSLGLDVNEEIDRIDAILPKPTDEEDIAK